MKWWSGKLLGTDQIEKLRPESVREAAIKQAIDALPSAVEAAVKRHVVINGIRVWDLLSPKVDVSIQFLIAPRVTATDPPSLSDSRIDPMGISALISALIGITLKHYLIHCNTNRGRTWAGGVRAREEGGDANRRRSTGGVPREIIRC
jgi:hypothetical protein